MNFKTVNLYDDHNPSAAPETYVVGTYGKEQLAMPTAPSEYMWCANKIDWARVSISKQGVWILSAEDQRKLFENGELQGVLGGVLTLEKEAEELGN